MAQTYFWIIVGFLILNYLISRVLDILNSKRWSEQLPPEVEGIYDAGKYKKSQDYSKVKTRFGLINETFSLIIILVMLFVGGFAIVDEFIRGYTDNPVYMALLFAGILGLAADILGLPFDIYFTFVIENKFGFNRTKPRTFVGDKIKALIITAIIGGGLIALVTWVWVVTGPWFWLITWGVLTLIMIVFMMFYSNLIVPLFNKQTPLEDGELRDEIQKFAERAGFRLNNIYVIDGSKRSSKANAYFTGIGPKKRIVLYDTLIKEHTVEELVAVLAHEIGHYKKRHTTLSTAISVVQTGFLLFILSFFLGSADMASALSVKEPSFHISVITFGLLYSPLSLIIGLALNALSRKNEYAADRFAGENYKPEALQSALKKLSVNNLSNLTPHPAYVFFYYSHPPLLQRLRELNKLI